MCVGRCARCIGGALIPLAAISILCNVILFFPEGRTKYVIEEKDGSGPRITQEVKYMGGLVGGGVLVLIPAIHILSAGTIGFFTNRCGLSLSIVWAAVGLIGALYSLIVAVLGIINGPTCRGLLMWGRPFKDGQGSYLNNRNLWSLCREPSNVVEFNLGLFSILLVASFLEVLLCILQMANGLFGKCLRRAVL